jgi:hypothetical protein
MAKKWPGPRRMQMSDLHQLPFPLKENHMRTLESMKVVADVKTLIGQVRNNREVHLLTYGKARTEYIKRATELVTRKLAQLKEGRAVGLHFSLDRPRSYAREYDTVITLLELHTAPTIELDALQARSFVMDDWDWKPQFVSSTSAYLSDELDQQMMFDREED